MMQPEKRLRQQAANDESKRVIVERLQEMFSVQYTYGKTAEDLKTLMITMIEDVGGYSAEAIDRAFTIWRRKSDRIPTPSNILDICKEIAGERSKERKFKTLSDFDGDFKAYKAYAIENGFWMAERNKGGEQ